MSNARFVVDEVLVPDPPIRIGMEIFVNTDKGAKLATVLEILDASHVAVRLPNGKIYDGVHGRIRDREGFSPTVIGWHFMERR